MRGIQSVESMQGHVEDSPEIHLAEVCMLVDKQSPLETRCCWISRGAKHGTGKLGINVNNKSQCPIENEKTGVCRQTPSVLWNTVDSYCLFDLDPAAVLVPVAFFFYMQQ